MKETDKQWKTGSRGRCDSRFRWARRRPRRWWQPSSEGKEVVRLGRRKEFGSRPGIQGTVDSSWAGLR